MKAHAAVAVARGAGERTRITTLRSEPPLTLRPIPAAGGRGGGGAVVHLVGTSAGPLAGDDLTLDVAVEAGTELTVRSAAATLVQPGARRGVSSLRIDARLGAGARLVWAPEPTVLVRDCEHETRVTIALDTAARLVWRDEVVLGRHGEAPGSLLARLVVDRDGRPLLRNDLTAGPRWPGSLGPGGVGPGTRAVGTMLVVGPGLADAGGGVREHADRLGARAAVLALADDAALVTVVAPRAGAVSRVLDRAAGELAPSTVPA